VITARSFVELKAQDVRIYPALVIKDTPLERLYKLGKFSPLKLNEAVEVVAKVYRIFEEAGINIIRTGLHPSEGLLYGEDLIAGPFHVSFKELVLTKLWEEALQNLFAKDSNEMLEIFIPPGQINYAVGYKSTNKNMLLEKFKTVRFKTDQNLSGRNYYANFS
jgi:histone acetyltransferase (RNA polymerase elongator complex component)